MHALPVGDRKHSVHRHEIPRLQAVTEFDDLAVRGPERDTRLQVRPARLLAPVDHGPVGDAGRLVHDLAHRDALDQIDVMRDALALADDRLRMGVPVGELLAPSTAAPSSFSSRAP